MARTTLQIMVLLISGALFVSLYGCAGSAPKWVNKGSGAFQSDTKAFYGVGAIKGVQNKPLATKTADNRARAELGKIIETYSASLMRDYASSGTVDDFAQSTEEQLVEQAVKTFSATTLSGVQIINHWVDKKEGITYSLAKLDLDDFENQIDRAKALNGEVREHLRKNADRLFNDLSQEEAKHEQ